MLEFYKLTQNKATKLPLFDSPISAGLPAPAEDFIDKELDLNEFMIEHPTSTFFVKVSGSSMEGAAINDGDILVVDKSKSAYNKSIVVAFVNGEFLVKRILKHGNTFLLMPENPKYKPIKITKDIDFNIWGVVTFIIKKTK